MSTLSMTGFGNESLELNNGRINVEIRSLNSKYFDCVIKIPDFLKGIEHSIKEMLINNINRGKVEIKIAVIINDNKTENLITINAIKDLIKTQSTIKKYFPASKDLSIYEIMNSLQIEKIEDQDVAIIANQTLNLTKKCVGNYLSSCRREGERLQLQILTCIEELEKLVEKAFKLAPEAEKMIRSRIKKRLFDAISESLKESFEASEKNSENKSVGNVKTNELLEFIEDRLRIEASLATSKIDIVEELERISSHTIEIKRICLEDSKKAIGKKLDFLSQEMHREANTIGSKSTTIGLSNISIDMRLLIDQIKEQVQNIQ